MYKNPSTGMYEHDFRFGDLPRYHISYGVTKKADAERLHAVAVALFRARKTTEAVIDAMRRGDVTIEQLAQLREAGRPFTDALESIAKPEAEVWPVIADAIAQYVEALENNLNKAPRTARLAKQELARFELFLEETGRSALRLDEFTSSMAEEYQAALITAGLRPNTSSAYVSRVGSLYGWFIRRENRDAREARRSIRTLHVPLDSETISRAKTSRARFLSENEAQRLLAATPRQFLAPVAIGLFAGLRVDEMCHLRTEYDIDFELGAISIQRQPNWRPKTRRSIRNVPIADALRGILEYHLEHYASDEWMLPAFTDPTRPINGNFFAKKFARIVTDADLISGNRTAEGVSYHTLRHTFASWSLMRGTDVFTVSKLLGNSVKQVEDTYGHLALDFRKAAVDRLGGAISVPRFDSDEPEETATDNATGTH